jgi:hypothetical protein
MGRSNPKSKGGAMKTLDECATLEELVMSRRSCAAIPVANEAALQRAAELGSQQGWNEAIEAARKAIADNAEAFSHIEYHGGGDLGGYREQFACEQIDRDVAALKMPTQEKAEA